LLTPEHPSLFTGVLGVDINDNFVGSFLDDQNASTGLIQSQIVTLGSTYSIAGQTDWGIFTMTHAMNNTYSNPYEKTAWASAFAGAAEFGGYLSHNTNWTYRDAGYWKATITDGTWANGQIGGTVAGEFLSHKKYGTLTGKIQGVYTADAVGAQPGPGRTSSAAPGRRPAMSISAAPCMAGLTPCATASKAVPYMTKGAVSITTILSTMKMTMRSGRTNTPTQLTQTTSIKRRPFAVSRWMECRHRRFIARTRGHRT